MSVVKVGVVETVAAVAEVELLVVFGVRNEAVVCDKIRPTRVEISSRNKWRTFGYGPSWTGALA